MPDALPSPRVSAGMPLSLLLVDDDEDTGVIMAKLLQRRGHLAVVARSCAEAEAAFSAQKFDCLISDLLLPDGSGNDLMRAMGARYAIAGIAVSGSGEETDIEQALAAGFARHFTKPIDIERLQDALMELAGSAGARGGPAS